MDKQKNLTNAKAVFTKNNIKELFFTNDGQAFYGFGPAKVHQKEIGGTKDQIHTVKNGNYKGAEESVTDVVVADDPGADGNMELNTDAADETVKASGENEEGVALAKPRKKK